MEMELHIANAYDHIGCQFRRHVPAIRRCTTRVYLLEGHECIYMTYIEILVIETLKQVQETTFQEAFNIEVLNRSFIIVDV